MDERLNKSIIIVHRGEWECWEWQGSLYKDGYGKMCFRVDGQVVTKRAHRAVYEYYRGPIPEDMEIDHLCRYRRCVNPAHLEPVTHLENMRRAIHATKQFCIREHEFTVENTYVNPKKPSSRVCRKCRQFRDAQRTR